MSYLLDSDWVVDWLRGRVPALSLVQELASDALAISVITYGEAFEGIYYGQSRTEIERTFPPLPLWCHRLAHNSSDCSSVRDRPW